MKVAVGLSGGVDSSVAAALLKEQGHDVVGITMSIWPGGEKSGSGGHACYGPGEREDIEQARDVARALDIPFHVLDLSREYKQIVLDYFGAEYISGRTPNPCLRCNPLVKFGALLERARESGIVFEKFATGHYARVEFNPLSGRYALGRARDATKDQSYGLIFLSQEQLGQVMFPLGGITKKEVRQIAKKLGLKTHDIPDSQDFYEGDISDLIDAPPKPGKILDKAGNVLGTHQGVWNFTIGQRRGLRIPSRLVYVKAIDAERNAIIVGERKDLYSVGLIAGQINYVSVESIAPGTRMGIRIRHSRNLIESIVEPIPDGKIRVLFDEPQWGVAPGQAVALYDGDMVLAGGIIECGIDS